jgi:hypothetical protein
MKGKKPWTIGYDIYELVVDYMHAQRPKLWLHVQ